MTIISGILTEYNWQMMDQSKKLLLKLINQLLSQQHLSAKPLDLLMNIFRQSWLKGEKVQQSEFSIETN